MKRLAFISIGLALLGCDPASGGDAETDADTGGSSGGVTTGALTSATTDPTTTTATTTTSTSTTDPGTTTSGSSGEEPTASTRGSTSRSSSSGDESSSSSGTGEPDGLPGGADCIEASKCAGGYCYPFGLGGLCGECSNDGDCDFGCTQPNPLAVPPQGSFCNDGNLGDGCESDGGCAGLECVPAIEVPGILEYSTCGECDLDADCVPGEVCNIDLDILGLGGEWTCVPAGSVGLGEFCTVEGSGDQACESGHCANGTFEDLVEFGICSECVVDGDCPVGQSCNPPGSDPDGTVSAAFCS